MKSIKKAVKIIILLLLLIAVFGFLYLRSLRPTYEGNIHINKLQAEVEVYFDEIGVPHIYAENELDAQRVFGYLHAQDRLWQMELLRRLASGRLSEMFGEKTLRTDKLFSGLGIEEAAVETIKNLDKSSQTYLLSEAYLDGINQFIEQGPTPLEFKLLGINKEKYSFKDIYNVYGYMAFSFASAHKTDPVLTSLYEQLGPAYIKELNIPINTYTALLKTEKNPIIESGLANTVHQIFNEFPVSPFIGSNSWVIGPEKTKNGKVIMANDPHIGFSQPAVWYQSHIITPTYERNGFNLGLTPFPLLMHNKKMATGLTMFANDDIDFYYEENNPNNEMEYKSGSTFLPYKIYPKSIKVKGGKSVDYDLKVSRHGPMMNGIIDHIVDKRPIAMDWVYTANPNKLLEATYTMTHANNMDQFIAGVKMIHAPGLNVMYGDAVGNIGWFAAGKLYELKDSVNSKLILNGASGQHEKVRYLTFDENPQAINPQRHYVYSANNQPDSIGGRLYPGYYRPEDRGKRIVHLLERKNDFTKEDVMKMINDVTSSVAPSIINDFVNDLKIDLLTAEEKHALQYLREWDGSYELTAVAPTIYSRLVYEFVVHTYKDELGKSFNVFINSPIQDKNLAVQMGKSASIWWDNIHTKNKIESKSEILMQSFRAAFQFLVNQLGTDQSNWNWSRVHTLEHGHPVGQNKWLRTYFNVGPFEITGGTEVINNMSYNFDSTGYYKVTSGPSSRRVIDFSDIENSMGVIPTGQSGNLMSPHYQDQADTYNKGEFYKMLMNEGEIKSLKRKLIFN